MTNDVVFFGLGNKDGNSLRSWRRFSKTGEGEVAFNIKGGVRIDDSELSKTDILNKARKQLDKTGGMILDIDRSMKTKVRVHCKNPSLVWAPRMALLLTLGGQCRWEKLNDSVEFECEPWECLIVPAAADVERQLKSFVDSLNGLPEDYRVSMLLNLVLPTFENRVARLEQIVEVRKTIKEAVSSSLKEKRQYGIDGLIGFWDHAFITAAFVFVLAIVGYIYFDRTVVKGIEKMGAQINDLRFAREASPPTESIRLQRIDIELAKRTGTVTLSRPASQHTVVNITSNDRDALNVQPELSIQPGDQSGTFTVRPGLVTSRIVVIVRAQYGGSILSKAVTVQPPKPGSDP